MIRQPTCLLLGAGASCHLGYPLGTGLRDKILNLLPCENPDGRPRHETPGLEPFHKEKLIPLAEACELQREDLIAFHTSFSRGGWNSPDEFLGRNSQYMAVGKYLIAKVICECEDVLKLFPSSNNGWYGRLADALITDNREDFKKNRLSIVTFNYDRSVDCFLHNLVRYRYDMSSDEAWELVTRTIPIIHLHGIAGSYPEVDYGSSRDFGSTAQEIKILPELEKEVDLPLFSQAQKLLMAAKRIITIGFSFGHQNVQRLDFFSVENLEGREFQACVGPMGSMDRKLFLTQNEELGLDKSHVHCRDSRSFFSMSCHMES